MVSFLVWGRSDTQIAAYGSIIFFYTLAIFSVWQLKKKSQMVLLGIMRLLKEFLFSKYDMWAGGSMNGKLKSKEKPLETSDLGKHPWKKPSL